MFVSNYSLKFNVKFNDKKMNMNVHYMQNKIYVGLN